MCTAAHQSCPAPASSTRLLWTDASFARSSCRRIEVSSSTYSITTLNSGRGNWLRCVVLEKATCSSSSLSYSSLRKSTYAGSTMMVCGACVSTDAKTHQRSMHTAAGRQAVRQSVAGCGSWTALAAARQTTMLLDLPKLCGGCQHSRPHLHGCPGEAVHQHAAFRLLTALHQQRLEDQVADRGVRYQLAALHHAARVVVRLLPQGKRRGGGTGVGQPRSQQHARVVRQHTHTARALPGHSRGRGKQRTTPWQPPHAPSPRARTSSVEMQTLWSRPRVLRTCCEFAPCTLQESDRRRVGRAGAATAAHTQRRNAPGTCLPASRGPAHLAGAGCAVEPHHLTWDVHRLRVQAHKHTRWG